MASTANWSDFSSIDGSRVMSIATERLPRWVTLLLVVAIAWQLVRIVWMLIPVPVDDAPIVAPASQIAARDTRADQADVRLIAASHLFGVAKPEDAAITKEPVRGSDIDSLPDARVNFSVKGIIAASDPSASAAIIADASKEENVYQIGALIQPGTTLAEVHTDVIVINQNGALFKLALPKDFPNGASSIRSVATLPMPSEPGDAQTIQNVVAQNVASLTDVIRPTPYYNAGQMQGYRVYPGRDRKRFASLGLRPGDLIKDVDGAALTDPAQAMQVFENLGNAQEVSVTVERDGQSQTLVLNASQLDVGKDN